MAQSLVLASFAVDILVYAAYVPLAFVVYDNLVVPIVTRVRTSDASSVAELAWTLIITTLTLPLLVGRDLMGINLNAVGRGRLASLQPLLCGTHQFDNASCLIAPSSA